MAGGWLEAAALLTELREGGFRFRREGTDLMVRPAERLTATQRDAVKANRAGILEELAWESAVRVCDAKAERGWHPWIGK